MEDMNPMRADAALTARGLAPSRERAQGLIRGGLARVNGRTIQKCSQQIRAQDHLEVIGDDLPYVSRGGLKLAKALDAFQADPSGLVCMDIGASTGGFTDVLLKRGAKMVYAIDVGTGQLHPSLQNDPRVVSMEQTNARSLRASQFPELPKFAVMDVSFISIELILPAAFGVLGDDGRMICLVKPQFEAGPKALGKKGVVRDPKVHLDVLRRISAFVDGLGWHAAHMDFSPIRGTSGNIEFLADLVPGRQSADAAAEDRALQALVESAHRQMKG